MKRSCYMGKERTCLALYAIAGEKPICMLGYSMASDYDKKYQIHRNPRPLEWCPKPMTNMAFCNASHKSTSKKPQEGKP